MFRVEVSGSTFHKAFLWPQTTFESEKPAKKCNLDCIRNKVQICPLHSISVLQLTCDPVAQGTLACQMNFVVFMCQPVTLSRGRAVTPVGIEIHL